MNGLFTYKCSENLSKGMRVIVGFGRRTITGIVIKENTSPSSDFEIKEVTQIFNDGFIFPEKYLDLIFKMSDYYLCPQGLVLAGVLSGKLLSMPMELPAISENSTPEDLFLNEDQQAVYENIKSEVKDGFTAHLIHGVTGSGKTEIYVELAKDAIDAGKQVLYLVPEISLTPQLIKRISSRLGFDVPTYHSKQTPKKRKEAFFSFASGQAKFLIGARSALFVPAADIGLIIVDEEHESGYKQEEAPGYNTRDMAVMYSSLLRIPCVLGSATPSVESMYNAKSGKYRLHTINHRHFANMPDIDIIDMKEARLIHNIISERLYDEVYQAIKRDEQAILLINRKGYSHTLYCRGCGGIINCSNCSVALTYYKSAGLSKCSYCGTTYKRPKCEKCGSDDITDYGAGTEKAAEIIEELFGEKVLRLDTDTVTSFNKLDQDLEDFKNGKYKIMTGTQIVAKGLHFPNVTLVGVLHIDNIFALPDFRSNERAYQLLMQVAGRSGRGEKHGKVIIQTNCPEIPVFDIVKNNPEAFYELEFARRGAFSYPPYTRICRLILSHTNEESIKKMSDEVSYVLNRFNGAIKILGPSRAPIYKVKNRFRYNFMLKSDNIKLLNEAVFAAIARFDEIKKGNMLLKIDRDPHFFM